MIWHHIDRAKGGGVQSESLDDYSVTYSGTDNGYPAEITAGLAPWRKVDLF